MQEPRYISFLLRLWQTEGNGELVWRISLETPQDGERIAFASLAALLSYLEREIGEDEWPGRDPNCV